MKGITGVPFRQCSDLASSSDGVGLVPGETPGTKFGFWGCGLMAVVPRVEGRQLFYRSVVPESWDWTGRAVHRFL